MGEGRPAWLSDLASEVCRESGVEFAVAFGSRVEGEERRASDIDIAVKFAESAPPKEQFQLLCSLSGRLQRSDFPFVDVSDIETLPLPVARRAIDGELVCGDELAYRRFRSGLATEYDAIEDELRRHRRDVIERISEGGLRG